MKFTESHEWVAIDGEIGTVGVTSYAQHELGDIVYVELPEIGKQIKKGTEAAVLESTKAAADVYAPVSGTITDVNNILKGSPELVNTSPQDSGWLFKLKLSQPTELDGLMDETSYQKLVTD